MFNLPRHHFQQSANVWRDISSISTADENTATPRRLIDEQIIHLKGISKADFQLTLKAMFPESLWGCLESELAITGDKGNRDPLAAKLSGWEDWASALRVSTQLQLESVMKTSIRHLLKLPITDNKAGADVLRMATEWELEEIRQKAIGYLGQQAEGVEKIHLATEFKMTGWQLEGYRQLVERNRGISSEEEESLGWETTMKLFKLRHRLIQRHINSSDLDEIIYNTFAAELEDATSGPISNGTQLSQAMTKNLKTYLINKETVIWVESRHFSSVIILVGFFCFQQMYSVTQ